MPPYPPDANFQEYAHARLLSPTEKSSILSWIDLGSLEGNAANTPPQPVFNSGSILGNGDLEIRMPNYTSKANGFDDYVCLSVPTNLTADRQVKAIEIVPGNRQIVHHCLVFLDETGNYVTDTIGGDCVGPNGGKLLMAYTPGASPMVLPSSGGLKLGMNLTSGSNIVLSMHYPNGSAGMLDSTKVIFHFYPQNETGIREVSVASILENWNIALPPNQVNTITAQYPFSGTLPIDFSLLSVFPHMHNLGKEIKAYGLNSQGDTAKYIHIKDWDFHWQDFYFFKNIQKAEAGSVIKGYGIYDNTVNNPNNPNSPPQLVVAGENTNDEMFLIYFHYMLYQAGDENYDLEALMSLGLEEFLNDKNSTFLAFPNPFDKSIEIRFKENMDAKIALIYIYDMQGNLVKKINSIEEGKITWDGKNELDKEVSSGTYILSANLNGKMSHQTIIKK